MSRRIIVVGSGPAGTMATIAAKREDPEATVILVAEELHEPYEKPPLSKAALSGRAHPTDALIAGAHLSSHGITLRSGVRCESVDTSNQRVVLQNGETIEFDRLVLATGCVARELPSLPPGTPHVHYLRSAEDAIELRRELENIRHLTLIGGGVIGLEVAASATLIGV